MSHKGLKFEIIPDDGIRARLDRAEAERDQLIEAARTGLDQLGRDYPAGTRVHWVAGPTNQWGDVLGVVWSLPAQPGGPAQPALVVRIHHTGAIGAVLPTELTP